MSFGQRIVHAWEINRDQRVVLYDDGVFFVHTITHSPAGKRGHVEQISTEQADGMFPGARRWHQQVLSR